jgi:hypothetical protein
VKFGNVINYECGEQHIILVCSWGASLAPNEYELFKLIVWFVTVSPTKCCGCTLKFRIVTLHFITDSSSSSSWWIWNYVYVFE